MSIWSAPVSNGEIITWTLTSTLCVAIMFAGYFHPKEYRIVLIAIFLVSTAFCFLAQGYAWGIDAGIDTLLPFVDPSKAHDLWASFQENNWLFTRLILVCFVMINTASWMAGVIGWLGITASNRESEK